MNHVEAIKKELVWIRQFIHKKNDENVVIRDANGKDIASWIDRVDNLLATPPAAQQEPVACQYAVDVAMPEYRCVGKCIYTTPPAAQRQPLTDEEIMQTWEGVIKYAPGEVRLKDFARAIEAAHGIKGEKNHSSIVSGS